MTALLLLLLLVVATGTEFLMVSEKGDAFHAYNLLDHGAPTPIRLEFGAPGRGDPPASAARLYSRGKTTVFQGLPSATSLSLYPDGGVNSLWVRWRYATVTNTSLALHAGMAGAPPFYPDVTLACRRGPADLPLFCPLGNMTVVNQDGASVGVGGYPVTIDLDRERGVLPANLYFLLTTENIGLRHGHLQSVAMQRAADATSCLVIRVPGGGEEIMRLCENDIPYFGMATAGNSSSTTPTPGIIIGRMFWRANLSAMMVDGWTDQVHIQFAVPLDATGWQALEILGLVIGGLTSLLHFLWASSDTVLTLSLHLAHLRSAASKGGGHRRRHRWYSDTGLFIGSVLLPLLTVGAVTVAWVSIAGHPHHSATPTFGPNLVTFTAGLTAFVGVQVLLGLSALLYDASEDEPSGRGGGLWQWIRGHTMNIRLAWIRHLCFSTATLGATILAFIPPVISGAEGGDTILLMVIMVYCALIIFHHTYYAVILVSLAFGSADSQTLSMAVALGEAVLYLGAVTGITLWYYVPVVDSLSVFYGQPYTLLGGMMTSLLPIIARVIMMLREDMSAHTLTTPKDSTTRLKL